VRIPGSWSGHQAADLPLGVLGHALGLHQSVGWTMKGQPLRRMQLIVSDQPGFLPGPTRRWRLSICPGAGEALAEGFPTPTHDSPSTSRNEDRHYLTFRPHVETL